MNICLIAKIVVKLSTMPKLLEFLLNENGTLTVRYHFNGCVVEDFIGAQAFNCPSFHNDCLFVEAARIGLVVD